MILGWGLMIRQLEGEQLQRAPEAVRGTVRASASSWFLADSAGPVAAGAALNVVPNLVFLALFLLPLRRARAAVVG